MVSNKDSFCLLRQHGLSRCSLDATRIKVCEAGKPGGPWSRTFGAEPRDIVPQYQYGGKYIHNMRFFDHCPIFDSHPRNMCTDPHQFDGKGVAGPDSRCFEVGGDPYCIPVSCAADRRSYTIHHDGYRRHVPCFRKGQKILMNARERVTCESPTVICASWRFAHLSPSSPFNRVPNFMTTAEPEKEPLEPVSSIREPGSVPSAPMAFIPELSVSGLTFTGITVVPIS